MAAGSAHQCSGSVLSRPRFQARGGPASRPLTPSTRCKASRRAAGQTNTGGACLAAAVLPLTHALLASEVPQRAGPSTGHRRCGSWSPRVRRLLATPPKLGVFGDDTPSITRGRAHGQDRPPAARGLSRAPGCEAVPLRPPGARGHEQDVQQISVCFTSLLDHLDTKSLQQRDTSLSSTWECRQQIDPYMTRHTVLTF